MGKNTKIEWCDSTLNLQAGCDGCELWNPKAGVRKCYAGTLHERYAGKSKGYPISFDKPRIFPDRLIDLLHWPDLTGTERPDKPWLNGLPRLVFLNDMGDTFTESLDVDWLAPFLPTLADTPHVYIVLTKRANRMLDFFSRHPVPKNFWLLTSVTSAANYNRIAQLVSIPGASVYGISYEPAHGPIDLSPWLLTKSDHEMYSNFASVVNDVVRPLPAPLKVQNRLNWVISGGESGADAAGSPPEWFRSVRDQCAGKAAYFHKQNGEYAAVSGNGGRYKYLDVPVGDGTWHRLFRIGTKTSGSLLDGVEHKEFPV